MLPIMSACPLHGHAEKNSIRDARTPQPGEIVFIALIHLT